MSWVTVMMWQPTASACKTFSSSRGLAQISSIWAWGASFLYTGRHQRDGIAAGVGDPASKHRDVARGATGQVAGHVPDLLERHQRRYVDLDARLAQRPDEKTSNEIERSGMAAMTSRAKAR